VNSRRYTILYFKQGSDIGEAFKLFSTSNGSQGVPFHVNMGGIEDVGDALGGDFVGFELEERLVLFDHGAVGDVPLGEDAGADGFAEGRDFDFVERHGGSDE
jgi:hypothetical protein